MTASQYAFATVYPNLSDDDQIKVLFEAIYKLSFEGRGTYVPGGHGLTKPERLRIINEALHRIADHGQALAIKYQPRRSDADVVQMLSEISESLELPSDFWERILDKLGTAI